MFIVINNSGNILAFLIPNLMVNKGNDVSIDEKKTMVRNYLILETIIPALSCLLSLIAYIDPEYEEELLNDKKVLKEEEGKNRGFKEEFLYIWGRKLMVLFIIIQMIGFGLIISLASVITDILVIFDYKEVIPFKVIFKVIGITNCNWSYIRWFCWSEYILKNIHQEQKSIQVYNGDINSRVIENKIIKEILGF